MTPGGPTPPPPTVLLTTVGSLGDLYPILSVARALRDAGAAPVLALTPEDCLVAERWGFSPVSFGPSQAEICDRLGVTMDDVAAEILRDPGPLLRTALMPLLPDLVRSLEPLAARADVIAATTFGLAAPIAAEAVGRPFVPIALQPMMMASAIDPPQSGAFRAMVPRPGRLGIVWNRAIRAVIRTELARRHATDLSRVRGLFGLPAFAGTPLLDPGVEVPMRIGLWDAAFAPVPGDAPPGTVATGFPPSPLGTRDDRLMSWIAAGPPPLVVTLGSIAQALGGPRFWTRAQEAGRLTGLRTVLLHGGAAAPPPSPTSYSVAYAPHADIFPEAAAIVHHGGMGTTAEAIRSGRPQVVVPIGGDQPDNAERLRGMGLAVVVKPARFTARRAAEAVRDIQARFDADVAEALADTVGGRDGAAGAARHLMAVARRYASSRPFPAA